MKTCKSIMILLVTLSLMVPHLLQAVVINVPEDIETIQGAIQASEDGDVVLVAPGEYDENLDFLGKAITVTSHIHLDDNRDFIENTIIDGGRRDCVVAFNNEEGRNSVLRGFTIQNGIQDCGGGIDCQRLSSPELNDLLVTGNEARGYGGGIYFSFRTTPLIQRTTISNNRSSFGGGGVATCFPSSGQLSHVIISNNFATSRGGGIYSESGGSFEMDHVLIADNSTNGRGGGTCITESGTSRFTNVTFSGNNAAVYPALESSISEFEMINCIIWDNADGVNYLATYFREDDDENEPSVYSFSYCDIQGGMDNFQLSRDPVVNWDEDSNIEINPLFIDPEGGNYYLNPESQCIDIGNPEFDEDPDGTRSDLGAFYFDQREMEQNIPNIALRWEIGWDENQIDWNRYFDEIYTDGEYTIPITVVNTGTEELQIEDITIENNSFNVQPAQFNLQSRDTRRVNITFTPEEAGEIQCCIRIFSNDPDEPQVDIRMSVVTAPRPIIFVNPLNFNDELNTGNTNVHEIAIGNNGESNLTWHIERELISEPDPEERQNGPRRDDVGDLLGEIEFNFGVIRGITSDGELIWLVSHNNNRTGNMFAIDPFNHEVVREFSWDNMAPDDIFWDGEVFWVAGHLNGNNVFIILDNEGNIVDQIEMPAPRMAALGFNGEDLMFSYSYDTHAVYIVQKDNFNLEIIAEIPRGDIHGIMGGANIGGIEWVPAHDDGHLWMVYRNNPIANLAQCKINADWEIEAIQTIELEDRGYGSLWHDGVNLWTGGGEDFRFVKIWDDGIHEIYWFTIDTYEGTLQTDDEQIIELNLDATSLIGGEYRGRLNVFSNDPVDPEIEIEINLDVIGAPDMEISWEIGQDEDQIDFNAYFDEMEAGGEYRIPIEIRNNGSEVLEVEGIEFENNLFSVAPNGFDLDVNERLVVEVIYSPDVNGISIDLLTIHSNDPDGDMAINLVGEVSDIRQLGSCRTPQFRKMVKNGDYVYCISRGTICVTRVFNPNRPAVVFNANVDDLGEEVRIGLTAIAYRENTIYTSFGMSIFGDMERGGIFEWTIRNQNILELGETLGTNSQISDLEIQGNYAYTLNDDGDGLSAVDIVDRLAEVGSCQAPTNEDGGLSISGDIAYIADFNLVMIDVADPENPDVIEVYETPGSSVDVAIDGEYAYVLGNESGLSIIDVSDPDNPEEVAFLEIEGEASEIHIQDGLAYAFSDGLHIIDVSDVNDLREVDYFSDARSGLIEGDRAYIIQDRRFAILDLSDVQSNWDINSEITVNLQENWNLISININPDDEFYIDGEERGPDIISMMDQLRIDEDNHHVRLLKNEDGLFYTPAFGFGNIQYWNLTEGYLINVDADVEATYVGEQIPFDTDIPLEEGWNYIAYLPTYELDANRPDYYTLSPIIDHVIIAKDGEGHFMLPGEFEFSNMPPWRETQGYQVRVDDDVVLNYPPEREEDVVARNQETKQSQRLRHFVHNYVTGENMSVLISSINGIEAHTGSEIAAFNSGEQIVGTGIVNSEGQCGLAVWGDDPATDQSEGLQIGEAFTLTMWDAKLDREIELTHETNMEGNRLIYETDGLSILEMEIEASIPDEFFLSDAYPNPFNASVRLSYGLPEDVVVKISVYDISGRLVSTLISSKFKAGIHSVIWESRSSAAGIYFIQMSTGDFRSIRKVTLLK